MKLDKFPSSEVSPIDYPVSSKEEPFIENQGLPVSEPRATKIVDSFFCTFHKEWSLVPASA